MSTIRQVRCLYSLPFLGCYDSVISGFHSLSSNSTRRSPKPDWADGERWRRARFGCGRDYICCGGEGREAERNDAVLGSEELRRQEYMPPPCSQPFTVWVFLLWSIEIWILSELLSGLSFQFLVLILINFIIIIMIYYFAAQGNSSAKLRNLLNQYLLILTQAGVSLQSSFHCLVIDTNESSFSIENIWI